MTSNNKFFSNRRRLLLKVSLCAMILILALSLCPALQIFAEEQTDQAQSVQTVEVGIPVEEHPELFLTRSMPTHGDAKIAVFLIQFPDYMNDNPLATREFYNQLYFGHNVDPDWIMDTVSNFYYEQSYGKLNISGQVFDWYTAKHERAYYDNRKLELIIETAEYYMAQGVDFSQFDGDGDGVIDALAYHFAGPISYNPADSWYHGRMTAHPDGMGMIGDMKLLTLVQIGLTPSSILNTSTTICHELMHTLGMSDLYGEVYAEPTTDLMVSNTPTINPYTKILLGWLDTVKVITTDAKNVKLDLYGTAEMGDVAIVTNEFNGFFDELFVVAYRKCYQYTTAVVWQIDARPNENGTGFLCSNLDYQPRPDKDTTHNITNVSPYLFVEELSSDPNHVRILNGVYSLEQTAFVENSVLGPDSYPSSDRHDGDYTGIRMYNFVEHNDEYLTFDVSFVDDTTSPVITTDEDELDFKKAVKIHFNEYIYKGEAFDNIQVTDLDGNPLDTSVIIPHYPRQELEITFSDDSYKRGYRIILPEGCVRDSSGNGIEAVTLTASADKYMLPLYEEMLPGIEIAGDNRQNGNCFWFPQDDEIVVMNGIWVNHVQAVKIEIMRLDLEGNVLSQVFFENPFYMSIIHTVYETKDGNYIFFCEMIGSQWTNAIFCVDKNGNVKWVNDSYIGTDADFVYSEFYQHDTGVVVRFDIRYPSFESNLVLINSQTGEVSRYIDGIEIENSMFNAGKQVLPDGRFLQFSYLSNENGKRRTQIELVDSETNQVLAKGVMEYTTPYLIVEFCSVNEDGTIMMVTSAELDRLQFFLFDVNLNCIKSIPIQLGDSTYYLNELKNDGFYILERTLTGDHANNNFHVYRYDKHLNLLWESDTICNFIYYFKSPSGEILAYKSMLEPERECYIEYYGNEQAYIKEHTHSLQYADETPATCQGNGYKEHLYCAECGCWFTSEDETLITDIRKALIPILEHDAEIMPEIPPSCRFDGNTAWTKCKSCGIALSHPETLPRFDHTAVPFEATPPSCRYFGITEGTKCSVCGLKLSGGEAIPKTEHIIKPVEGMDSSCLNEGFTSGTRCEVCLMIFSGLDVIPKKEHTVEIMAAVEATCLQSGHTAGTHCTVCRSILSGMDMIPQKEHIVESVAAVAATCTQNGHTAGTRCILCGTKLSGMKTRYSSGQEYGLWETIQEITCVQAGLSAKTCSLCGAQEKIERDPDPKYHNRDIIPYVAPTCNSDGSTAGEMCTVCGEILNAPTVIPANNVHNFDAWLDVTEPTCTKAGTQSRICVVCGKEETREIPSKGGHSFASWVTLEDATCIKDGIQTRTCTQCGEVEQITNPKSDKYHRYGNWVVIQEPSCNTKGLSVQRCQVCSAELNKQSIPASDKYHKPGDWVVTREPTADEYGEEARICPECGKAQETRRINKLPVKEENSIEKPSDNPQAGEPASGCNSTVGFGSAIVISLIFTCSAFFFKRKEN